MKLSILADECPEPLRIIYETVAVADHDDFPDGNYELTFHGQTVPLTRKDGVYVAKR